MILIKAQRDALLLPLQMVSGIVERRHTLPILSNVLIKKLGTNVSLISTDIEMQITSTVEMGSGSEDSSTTVSARKFLDILRALPNDNEVVVSMAGRKMSIAQGKSRFQLQTLAAEEFPTVTLAQTYPAIVSLSQKDFKLLLHLVHFSMAQQDIRYYLNGLLLVIEADQLTKSEAQRPRKDPFGVLLHGASKICKSQLTQIMIYHYAKVFGLPPGPEYIYTRCPKDEFWSGFNSTQWCIIMDDIAFMKPGMEMDPSLIEMLQVKNSVPYVPPQAALS